MLLAPISEQRCLKEEYSSSDRRTLIMRDRGFKTVILDSVVAEWFASASVRHKSSAS